VVPGFDAISLPGERHLQSQTERACDGVPILPALLAPLDALAKDPGLTPLRAREAR